jgi:peptidoglycan hydrolase-like protein with peptidoglycan-binding domain
MPPLRDPEAQHQHSVPPTPMGPQVSDSLERAKALQRKLNSLGANLVVDGYIGPKTQAAMRQYGIDANGNPVGAAPSPAGPAPAGPGQAAPSGGPTPAAGVPAAGTDDDVRAKFGGWAWALDVPEVGDILRNAAAQGWSDAQTQGAIQGTNWWKQTAGAGRKFQALQGSDPAEANAQILQKKADLGQIAAQLGISIGDDRLTAMATDALRYGLDATGLQQMIGSEFHYTPGHQTGTIGQAELTLKSMAGDYLLPLSDETLSGWEGQIAQGRGTAEGFRGYMLQQAKDLYGKDNAEVSRLLDDGSTMTQIVQPYRDLAVSELGVAGDSIDFRDPKWLRAVSTNDPDTGQRRMMNQWEWQRTLRGDEAYGWSKTAKGRQATDDFKLNLLQALGVAK